MKRAFHIFVVLTVFCLCAVQLAGQNAPSAQDSIRVQVRASLKQAGELWAAKQPAEAIALLKKVSEVCEQSLGETAPETAFCLLSLGAFYSNTGDYGAAEPILKRQFNIVEKTIAPEDPYFATALNSLAAVYVKTGNYAAAELLYKRRLAIFEKTLGANHLETGMTLKALAECIFRSRPPEKLGKEDYDRCEAAITRALPILKKQLGPENVAVAEALYVLGSCHMGKNEFAAAVLPLREALEIKEKNIGAENSQLEGYLSILISAYMLCENHAAVVPLCRRQLALKEKRLGLEHLDLAGPLFSLANAYQILGDYAAAELCARRAVTIREKTSDSESVDIAQDLKQLGHALELRGNYDAAESALTRALAIFEKKLGPDHLFVAACLGDLGSHYRNARNDCLKAEPLLKRSLEIRQKSTAAESRRWVAESLAQLGVLYANMGNFADAERFLKCALQMCEEVLGLDHPDTAACLLNVANLYRLKCNFTAAERLCKRSLSIFEKMRGLEHPDTGKSLNQLALLYVEMGNYVAAEPLCKRSLSIKEKTFGAGHRETATALENLALLYNSMGNITAAEPLLKRSLAIREKVLGPDHPDTAVTLHNLASFYSTTAYHAAGLSLGHPEHSAVLRKTATDRYATAENLHRRALAIHEKALGKNHPNMAFILNGLACLHIFRGNYAAAEPLCRRVAQIQKKFISSDHPYMAAGLSNLAACLVAEGKPSEALAPQQEVWESRERQRDRIFAFASEQEQAAYNKTHDYDFHGSCSLVAEHIADNPIARCFALGVVLSSKGAALEALSQRRANVLGNAAPELKPLFAEWQNVGTQLSKAVMATPPPGQLTNHLARIAELEKSKEVTEQALARASARFASERHASRVTLSNVARALPAGSALVEFAEYMSPEFGVIRKEKAAPPPGGWRNYIALVLRGGGTNAEPEVALVRLGSADKVEAAVRNWRKASAPDEQGRRSDKTALDAASQELAALVWNPIVPALAGCRKLYLSPDGELAFVSFGALPGSKPDSFVIDDYDITYVATGRDLVRQGGSQDSASLLVGAPDFGEQQGTPAKYAKDAKGEDELLAMRPGISDLRSFTALNFAPLPGTRMEVEDIGHLLQDHKEKPNILTGAKADEATVKAAKHPGILHLATHGFFLPDSGLNEAMSGNDRFQSQLSGEMREAAAGKLWRQMKLKNPMHRSGIALAGANDTIYGRREAGGNDGILTAEEVAGMDLWGTKMVVISACESGLGEAKGGEGVFGLRRAFTMAGAQSLVMTLWAVSDDATRQLMESLYHHLPEQRTPQRALLAAQREWIAKKRAAGLYPHPVHWAGFVASGIGLALKNN